MTRRFTLAVFIMLIITVGCTGSPLPPTELPLPTEAPPSTDVYLPENFPPQGTPVLVEMDVNGVLGDDVMLKPGATAHYSDEDLSVRFVAVTEDSRCPLDVDCFWSGLARVSLEITVAADAPQTIHLELMAEQPVSQQVGNYTITLLAVAPDPISTNTIQPDEYRVTLRVDG